MSNNHILTCHGREHSLEPGAPYVLPSVLEIAHSLAQINRFTGHCARPYSVAEHSLMVADIALVRFGAPPKVRLAALFHDAHECITGDVASPIKAVLGDAWRAFEDDQQTKLLQGYGLLATYQQHHALIKQCDLIALATERACLMNYVPGLHAPWPLLDTPGQEVAPGPIDLTTRDHEGWTWDMWGDRFIQEFHNLRLAEQLAEPAHFTDYQTTHHD